MSEEQSDLNILDKKVGDKEPTKKTLNPAKVTIASVVIKTKKANDEDMKTPLAQFMVKHPDSDDLITLSKVKYIEGDNIVAKSLWVQLDEDENIQKSSAIDIVLSKLGCSTLAETYGKQIDTVEESDKSSYLCLKAY